MATTTITGNIVRDPELRFTPNGQAVTNFSIAENRRWQDNDNEWQESTSYFDVAAWGELAENTAKTVTKGDRVTVAGRLDQRSWEDDQGGRRSKIELTATEVAVSLRFATATIAKIDRTHSDS